MILSYNKRFVPKWLTGQKKHTFRKDPHNRWHAGLVAQFATGVRTPHYTCFMERPCTGTQKIIIEHNVHALGDVVVVVDERIISEEEIKTLSFNDGFDTVEEFFNWFDEDFIGKIIHFTELRY